MTDKTDTTKRERVAKAIERCMFAEHELPLPDELHQKYLMTADAAIAAMEEPMKSHTTKSCREKYIEAVFLAAQLWKALERTKKAAEARGADFAPQSSCVKAINAFHKWNRGG